MCAGAGDHDSCRCILSLLYVMRVQVRTRVCKKKRNSASTVTLLDARARTVTAELARLHAARVRDEERAVVLEECVLDFALRRLVDEFLVVRDDALADGLADGVNLRRVTTAAHAHADVEAREALLAEKEHRLPHLD